MKNIKSVIISVLGVLFLFSLSSCKKFLDAKPDQKLSVPANLKDLQALLDNLGVTNKGTIALNGGTDEYYLVEANFNSLTNNLAKQVHIWSPQLQNTYDWNGPYLAVFQANTVLDNLKKISSEGQLEAWNNIRGEAFFFRAYHLFQIAQLFAPQYDSVTASNDLGIPLRLSSDFNELTTRSTVQQTYDQIINDLNETKTLLSSNIVPTTPLTKSRPSLAATYGLLARVYLQMGNYTKAKENSDLCLQQYNTLRNYNDFMGNLNTTAVVFTRFETEVIFYVSSTDALNGYDISRIDSSVYRLFDSSDIRKYVFFTANADGSRRFKGTYNGTINDLFNGIATDEIYLIRAECYARQGNTTSAMSDLNTLLVKRLMNTVPFVPITAINADDALGKILLEKKKELIYRGTRWSDLRRLNKDSRFATTIKRIMGSQTYTLPPNDLRYTLLIPQTVINLTGIPQNGR